MYETAASLAGRAPPSVISTMVKVPAAAPGGRTIVRLWPVVEQALVCESAIVTWSSPPATVATATTAGVKGTHEPVTDPVPQVDGALESEPSLSPSQRCSASR